MNRRFNQITRLSEFDRDMKKLKKRFSTLEEDLNSMIDASLVLLHKLHIDNKGVFNIEGIGIENRNFYKVKKFACRSMPGKGVRSGIRVIYTYDEKDNHVELIEIYYKQDKESEDRARIRKHYADSFGDKK